MNATVAALLFVSAGCFSKPDFQATQPDAGPGGVAPVARIVGKAYAASHTATPIVRSSAGMTGTTWELTTTGVEPGDLLLFIANVDNGSNTVWPNPIADGFTELFQQFFGIDGQTFVVDWKIAGPDEPATYNGGFGQGISSAATTISMIAITGYDPSPMSPIGGAIKTIGTDSATTAFSAGLTTMVPDTLLIWAVGADWTNTSGGSNTFQTPVGFTQLAAFGDRGSSNFDWTSQEIAYRVQPVPGASEPISGELRSTTAGTPWNVVIAIPPPPP